METEPCLCSERCWNTACEILYLVFPLKSIDEYYHYVKLKNARTRHLFICKCHRPMFFPENRKMFLEKNKALLECLTVGKFPRLFTGSKPGNPAGPHFRMSTHPCLAHKMNEHEKLSLSPWTVGGFCLEKFKQAYLETKTEKWPESPREIQTWGHHLSPSKNTSSVGKFLGMFSSFPLQNFERKREKLLKSWYPTGK